MNAKIINGHLFVGALTSTTPCTECGVWWDEAEAVACSTAPKAHWVSRHVLSPAQWVALETIHGPRVVVKHHADVVFSEVDGLAKFIQAHTDGVVYAVGGAAQIACAVLAASGPPVGDDDLHRVVLGIFENDPDRRSDGQFGLSAVYHVQMHVVGSCGCYGQREGSFLRVWENPDPEADQGDALIPVG